MAWHDHVAYQPVITGDPASIRPLGDFVLVRPLSDEEGGKLTGTGLAELSSLSEFHMTADYRYRWNRPRGNRYGEVLACGDGDLMVGLQCSKCGRSRMRIAYIDATRIRAACPDCAGEMRTLTFCPAYVEYDPERETVEQASTRAKAIPPKTYTKRAEMFVHPGDIVVYPQVPANEIEINSEKLVFLHQEQHVLAVIEKEAA